MMHMMQVKYFCFKRFYWACTRAHELVLWPKWRGWWWLTEKALSPLHDSSSVSSHRTPVSTLSCLQSTYNSCQCTMGNWGGLDRHVRQGANYAVCQGFVDLMTRMRERSWQSDPYISPDKTEEKPKQAFKKLKNAWTCVSAWVPSDSHSAAVSALASGRD